MSRRNGKSKLENRHSNKLFPSSSGMVEFALTVEQKFLELCESYLRIKGVELDIPQFLDPAMLRWRQMRIRHKNRDFRHSEDEKACTKVIAEWTVEINAEMRNQIPKKIDWGAF